MKNSLDSLPEGDDGAELEQLLGKTHPNLFAGPPVGPAFLERLLVARRIMSTVRLDPGAACLALVSRGHVITPDSWRPVGHRLTVGRAPGNDWVVNNRQRSLSAAHFHIQRKGGEYLLTDLNSTNGTWVNEETRRIVSCSLCNGDIIHAGGCEFLFLLGDTAS